MRAACVAAVEWLGTDVTVLADHQGGRVAAHLLATTMREGDVPSYLVVGNGSACRTEQAPGHFDERAAAMESLTAIRRAGADMIITYFAKDAAAWLASEAARR